MRPNLLRTVRRIVPPVAGGVLLTGFILVTLADIGKDKKASTADSTQKRSEKINGADGGTKLSRVSIRPIGDWAVDPAETQELNAIYAAMNQAASAVQPGPDAGFQRRAIEAESAVELESFLTKHTNSAYGPDLRLTLARLYRLRSAYAAAMNHYQLAWDVVKGSPDPTADQMAREAAGGLATMLALTGRMNELDALEVEAKSLINGGPGGMEWGWAKEMRTWARKYPTEAYKCGLYCLDQLGWLTQPGQFVPKDIVETASSPNGFTAADLVRIGTKAGLRVRAALLTSPTNIPVPCVMHLDSEHFVMLSEKRGAFYCVYDTIAPGQKWLTASEIAREASGCV